MGGKTQAIDAATYDQIIMLREHDVSIEQTAVLTKTGHATVTYAWMAYKAVRDKDTDSLRRVWERRASFVEMAAAKLGVDALAMLNEAENAEQEPKPEPAKPDNTAVAWATMMESIKELTAAVNAIDKRLSAIQLTQQGFRGDVGEKIGKVIETVNVNGDILTKEHDKMIDLLGVVKSNTKRRPEC